MMKQHRFSAIRLVTAVFMLAVLAACTPGDYADGITSFSQAVTQANTTEQTLAAAAQQATFDAWIVATQAKNADVQFPDWAKCNPPAGSYHSGDCTVKLAGTAAPTATKSAMTSLMKYASALNAVVADKTCATLQSDSKDLATALGDIAKDANNTAFAAAASPLLTIVSTAGCFVIQTAQVNVLKEATSEANPLVQKLVPIISDRDANLQHVVINASANQLRQAYIGYLKSKSAADLKTVVTLAQALDQAQSAPVDKAYAQLATLHQTLTDDLASPTISLKRVENDAQSFIASAQSVDAAVKTLTTPTPAPAAKAK